MFDSTEWCVALLMYHRCVVQKFDTRATRIKDKKRFDKFGRKGLENGINREGQ